jgi:creatine kinase
MGSSASIIADLVKKDLPADEFIAEVLKLPDFMDGETCKIDAKHHEKLKALYAVSKSNPSNLSAKCFDLAEMAGLSADLQDRIMMCVNSGIENPTSGLGVYAMQPSDYDDLAPFFGRVLKDYHKITTEDFKHESDWTLPEDADTSLDLAGLGLPELSMRVRVGRNLKSFPLPGAMTKEDRVNMEEELSKAFKTLAETKDSDGNPFGGRYHSLTPGREDSINEEEYQALVDAHFMFKDMGADTYLTAAGIASDWPTGRGCYKSADEKFVIWVGEEDHMRIMCMFKGTKLADVFKKLNDALTVVSSAQEFAFSDKVGNVTSCPSNLGTGMRASVHIKLPYLTVKSEEDPNGDKKASEIAKTLGLSVRGLGGEHTPVGADGTVDISPSARFCIKESTIVASLYSGLKDLKAAEDAAETAAFEAAKAANAELELEAWRATEAERIAGLMKAAAEAKAAAKAAKAE